MYYGLRGKHVLSRFAHGRYALLAQYIMYAISQVEVSVCVTAVKDVSVSVTVGLPLSLERNTLVLTVAVILTTAIVRSTLGLVEREGGREGE